MRAHVHIGLASTLAMLGFTVPALSQAEVRILADVEPGSRARVVGRGRKSERQACDGLAEPDDGAATGCQRCL